MYDEVNHKWIQETVVILEVEQKYTWIDEMDESLTSLHNTVFRFILYRQFYSI